MFPCVDLADAVKVRCAMRAVAKSLALAVLIALAATPAAALGETIDQALCRMIESAATSHRIPVDFFTRLIWQERRN